ARLGGQGPVLSQVLQSLPRVLDRDLQHAGQRRERRVARHTGDADADGAGTRGGVPVAVGAAGELAVVEVERDHALENALRGERVGQALARVVAREVEAGRVEMTRVDEEAEAFGRRSHVA